MTRQPLDTPRENTPVQTSSRIRQRWLVGATLALAVLATGSCSRPERSVNVFEDVTPSTGFGAYAGMTHGAAWGDLDGDGLPDLYVTNHLNGARLYRNLGGGRFEDVTSSYLLHDDTMADKHGSAWADFDNDGRQDLVQLTGAVKGVGTEPKLLFHNRGDRLVNVAAALGVLNPEGRTRMPLWVDLDRDGRLDLFHGADTRLDDKIPPFFYAWRGNAFSPSSTVELASRSAPFCILTELNGDNRPELVCRIVGKGRTAQILDLATQPARDLNLLPATAFEDIAAADFDNDGQIDLFLARKNPAGPVAFGRPSEKEIVADVWIDASNVGKPAGIAFHTAGALRLHVAATNPPDAISPNLVHLGRQGTHPAALTFDLSPQTPGISGMAPHAPGTQAGVYIGFAAPDKWEVRMTAPREAVTGAKAHYQQVALAVTAASPITKTEAIGTPAAQEEAPARLFMNRGGKLSEESEKLGVNTRTVAGVNVVAGDFDNDMHVDLFVLASGDVGKQDNMLLLNRGDGHFDVVRAAGGAAGPRTGVGDSVTTVDFDGDGFLDIFVANGGSMGHGLGLPSEKGSYRLYRNIGNGNHWIEIDLEGVRSNRDGIGAVVHVTAGGTTQVRVQDGGVHHRGQNHQRLHFGLAKHSQIDKIVVHWPSGTMQELRNTKANQVLHIKEAVKSTAQRN